jgi:hypothetical protein
MELFVIAVAPREGKAAAFGGADFELDDNSCG